CESRQVEVDVLPPRIAVDLDRDAGFFRGGEDARPVGRHAGPRSIESPARVAEDVDAGRTDGAEHARGLVGGGPECRMRRGDDELEARELAWGHVDRAVGADVGLDALDESKAAAVATIQAIDLAVLLRELRHRQAAGDGE